MIPKSRKEALNIGETFYFTGKPCKKGHLSNKSVTRGCMVCARQTCRDLSRKYNLINKEKKKKYRYKLTGEQKQRIKERNSSYKERRIFLKRQYRNNNREKLNENSRTYFKNNPKKKLKRNILVHIRRLIPNQKINNTWNTFLDYNLEELVSHLEKRFVNSMSWDNYGTYWELDHIIPISKMESKDNIDLIKKSWNISNLQPLETSLNRSKNNKITGSREEVLQKMESRRLELEFNNKMFNRFKLTKKYFTCKYKYGTIELLDKVYQQVLINLEGKTNGT